MDAIAIDGLDEHDFRRSIENMLRRGEADGAASRLRALLGPFAGENGILPPRFLTVSSDELALAGWDGLEERIGEYDRPDHRISALSIAVTDPETAGVYPDEAGKLAPCIETSYFSDEAFPFSEAARSDLLEGYSLEGCEWQGEFETTDTRLSVEGIDDLYGAVARLEAKLMDSEEPRQDEIRAGSLGACYLAVLIHQAVRDSIRRNGLPRALCVMAGNNGVYPYFDAPVMSSEEYRDGCTIDCVPDVPPVMALDAGEPEASAIDGPSGYNSLANVTLRKGTKKPVIALDPEEAEAASRLDAVAAAQLMADTDAPRIGVLADLEASEAAEPVPLFASRGSSGEPDVFADLASFREAVEPEAYDPGSEPLHPDVPATAEELSGEGEDDFADEPVTATDEAEFDDPAELEAVSDASDERAELLAFEPPAVPALVQTGVPETRGREFPSPKPEPAPHGHRLRARIVQTSQPETTFKDRIIALLQWLEDWMKRRRK